MAKYPRRVFLQEPSLPEQAKFLQPALAGLVFLVPAFYAESYMPKRDTPISYQLKRQHSRISAKLFLVKHQQRTII